MGVQDIENNNIYNRNKLELLTKIYNIYKKIYPTFSNYKKEEKYALVIEIKQNLLAAIVNINLANYVKSKRLSFAQEAQACFESYRILIRLAYDTGAAKGRFINEIEKDNEVVSKMLTSYILSAAKNKIVYY